MICVLHSRTCEMIGKNINILKNN